MLAGIGLSIFLLDVLLIVVFAFFSVVRRNIHDVVLMGIVVGDLTFRRRRLIADGPHPYSCKCYFGVKISMRTKLKGPHESDPASVFVDDTLFGVRQIWDFGHN